MDNDVAVLVPKTSSSSAFLLDFCVTSLPMLPICEGPTTNFINLERMIEIYYGLKIPGTAISIKYVCRRGAMGTKEPCGRTGRVVEERRTHSERVPLTNKNLPTCQRAAGKKFSSIGLDSWQALSSIDKSSWKQPMVFLEEKDKNRNHLTSSKKKSRERTPTLGHF